MATMPAGYYSRFDASKNYERHLGRAGKVLQSAEFNEIQQSIQDRLKRIADVLFKDGAIIRDCGILVDVNTGACQLEGGAVYVRGAVRGVAPRTLTIPVIGTVQVGIALNDVVVTELEDPTLRDPAVGVRNNNEPGAARLRVDTSWARAGDGTPGEFYPVYTIVDGIPQSQQPPPQIDAVALAIASYDRQSAGGMYVSSGLRVTQLADADTGEQVYSMAEGVARVDGREVTIPHARRVVYAAVPDLKTVISEPHVATGGSERVTLNHGPVAAVDQVLIVAQRVLTNFQHGAFTGAQDTLPDSPVLSIVAVNQGGTWQAGSSTFSGGTTFVAGTDYKLTSDKVDWSLSGTEPAPGSSYTVVYRYVAPVTPTGVDAAGFTVAGAVPGSVTQITYRWKRPRIDRLCLDGVGMVQWVQGIPNDSSPVAPMVPPGLLSVATVTQTWTTDRSVSNDGTHMLPMSQLEAMQRQIDQLGVLVGEQALKTEIAISEPTNKRGLFVDPLLDDTKRDQGIAQTGAVFDGILTLPLVDVHVATVSLAGTATLPMNNAATAPVIAQTLRTSCMKVNPYDAFEPIPASAVLEPATDFWTESRTVWTSMVTRIFQQTRRQEWGPSWGLLTRFTGTTTQVVVDWQTEVTRQWQEDAQFLRPINIKFTLSGFGPGEFLDVVQFDGRPMTFTAA
ncbi:conserved protein of unknown function (plasmid) [Rhodovastum atsumiense]|uniref:DUF4815 domain-containing protein n=1 Tax=Rhodovastum atsumiense TaxID=504468 RepID=A0A5M6IVI2_9PROT|nr:DUF4815 domain-containing protein [Rhodovastum atsumiense]KAA5611568.1 DUF4815 domain-containing protein [Rhodovastum atsumiense]CAH2606197.1 conserved protein of unknown function [Rhodovastum atsumiense]